MRRERDVEGVSRAYEQMKPDEIALPVPDQMAGGEQRHDQSDVEREKIRRERDEKISLVHDHMAAFGGRFEFLHAPAKEPDPERVREFMADDVKPHRLGQE